jgi:hypothetical protein
VLDQNNFVGITTDKILKFDQDLKVSKESMLTSPTYPSITANKSGEIFIINSKYIFKLSKELTEMTTCEFEEGVKLKKHSSICCDENLVYLCDYGDNSTGSRIITFTHDLKDYNILKSYLGWNASLIKIQQTSKNNIPTTYIILGNENAHLLKFYELEKTKDKKILLLKLGLVDRLHVTEFLTEFRSTGLKV